MESNIQHSQEHLDGIGSLTFDDDCEHCVKNKNTPFVKQAHSLQSEIIELQNEVIFRKNNVQL